MCRLIGSVARITIHTFRALTSPTLIFWVVPADGEAAVAVIRSRICRGVVPSLLSLKVLHQSSASLYYRDIPPTMHTGASGDGQPSAPPLSLLPLVNVLSDVLPGTTSRHNRQTSALSASENKDTARPAPTTFPAAPTPLPALYTHARVIVGSEASTTDSQSELTSPSGESLPAHEGADARRSGYKQARNSRRPKSHKPQSQQQSRWSKGTSSDDTGSDRKTSQVTPTRSNIYKAAQPSQSSSPSQRQRSYPSLASNQQPGLDRRLMAANFGGPTGDARRGVSSPRPKGRGMKVWFE
jgi:PAB-dependent poly(A)-specific ribonuclease subunit 3